MEKVIVWQIFSMHNSDKYKKGLINWKRIKKLLHREYPRLSVFCLYLQLSWE